MCVTEKMLLCVLVANIQATVSVFTNKIMLIKDHVKCNRHVDLHSKHQILLLPDLFRSANGALQTFAEMAEHRGFDHDGTLPLPFSTGRC